MPKEALQQRDDMVFLNWELFVAIFYILNYIIDKYLGCKIDKEKRNGKRSPSTKRWYGMFEFRIVFGNILYNNQFDW